MNFNPALTLWWWLGKWICLHLCCSPLIHITVHQNKRAQKQFIFLHHHSNGQITQTHVVSKHYNCAMTCTLCITTCCAAVRTYRLITVVSFIHIIGRLLITHYYLFKPPLDCHALWHFLYTVTNQTNTLYIQSVTSPVYNKYWFGFVALYTFVFITALGTRRCTDDRSQIPFISEHASMVNEVFRFFLDALNKEKNCAKQLALFLYYILSPPNNIQQCHFSLQLFSNSLFTADAQSMSYHHIFVMVASSARWGNSVIRPMCLDCSAWKLSSIWRVLHCDLTFLGWLPH